MTSRLQDQLKFEGNRWLRLTPWFLLAAAFIGTCVVAWAIQLVLLPYFLPQLHAGHGMLVGGDSTGMHATAVALAERIRSDGWAVWELRPTGNAPTGIAAAVYVFVTPEPYNLVPLSALVHAIGSLVIYFIVYDISHHRLASVAAALPFLLFPSAASWYAQIHKDGIFALGMLLCALGWMQAFRRDFWLARLPRYAALLLPIAAGLFLVWLVRPHIMVLMQAVGAITTVFGLGLVLVWWRNGVLVGRRALTASFVFIAIPVLLVLAKPSDYRVESWKGSVVARESVIRFMPGDCLLEHGANSSVDKLVLNIAGIRDFFTSDYRNAKSNMDPEFVPGTLCNLLTYIPRALQIGFLAPFPSAWLADGSISATSMMRRIIGIEMTVTYTGLLLIPLACWRYRRKPEFWFVLFFFTLLTLIHVYLIPNLGTQYRMRYGFVTAVVGIAFSAAFNRAEAFRSSR